MARPLTTAELIDIRDAMADAVWQAADLVRADFNANASAGICDLDYKPLKNGRPDFVTKTDRASENLLKTELKKHLPRIPFVGEESGGSMRQRKFILADPLDGTSNFGVLGEQFAIVTAYIEKNTIKAAVMADPMRQILIKAAAGHGTFREYEDGRLAKLAYTESHAETLASVQLDCCVPMYTAKAFKQIEPIVQHMQWRKSGSTAYDLLNLVCGKKSVVISSMLKPWDIAAGLLLAREAGFVITDTYGKPATYRSKTILAGAPKHHTAVLKIMGKQPA